MARSPRIEFHGSVKHVVAHAVDGALVFEDDEERWKFLEIVRKVKGRRPFLLFALCLMSTHLHLLIRTGDSSMEDIMRDILGTYARWCNKKRGRRGHLFADRNKQMLCTNDGYLLELLRYIHMNPVDAGLCAGPADWLWSSHRVYLGADDGGLVDTEWVLSLFHPEPARAREAFAAFVVDRARLKEDPFSPPPGRMPVWTELPVVDQGDVRPPIPIEELCTQMCREAGIAEIILRGRQESASVCGMRHEFVRRAAMQGHPPRKIAEFLNRTPEAVRKVLRKSPGVASVA
ncbi:MAG: transposase [Elusimicrobia bacterium]|nr:transposase [Elusimicrobiota bacterium]